MNYLMSEILRAFSQAGKLVSSHSFESFVWLISKPESATQLVHGELPQNSSSIITWNFIAGCLDNCVNNHVHCGEDFDSEWLPTRLIDVGTPTTDHIRLVRTANRDDIQRQSKPRYIALSH